MLRVLKELAPRVNPIVVLESAGEFAARARQLSCEVLVAEMGVLRRQHMQAAGLVRCARQNLGAAWWLARLIRQRNVRLVFTSTVSVLAGALAAKLARRPHVWLVQEILAGREKLLSLPVSALSARIIAVSQAAARSVHRGREGARRTTSVAFPGVDCARFDRADGTAFRARHLTAEGQILIGLVGRIHYRKGHHIFLEALARLRQRGVSGFRAVMVGEPYTGYESLLVELRAKAKSLGLEEQVDFCGHVDDVAPVFKALDVVVVPSTLPESFCLVVVEGMAAHRPVIASRCGGPEEIIDHGVTGFLVRPSDAAELSERMEELISSATLRRGVGEAGRKRVESAFPAEGFESAVRSVVEQVLQAS